MHAAEHREQPQPASKPHAVSDYMGLPGSPIVQVEALWSAVEQLVVSYHAISQLFC